MNIRYHLEEILFNIESAFFVLDIKDFKDNKYHYFLIHSTIVFKILFYKDEKTLKELIKKNKNNKKELNKLIIGKNRKNELKDYFSSDYCIFVDNLKLLLKENKNKEFRNHLEHIDERLDLAISKGFIVKDNVSNGINIKSIFPDIPTESCLRNYEDGKFTFYDEKFDLLKLKDVLLEIQNFIKNKGLPENITNIISNNSFLNTPPESHI